jgi:hypothetical protein
VALMAGLQANETHNGMQKKKKSVCKKDYELFFFINVNMPNFLKK